MQFYLVQCENRNPASLLGGVEYVHVKAHVSGQQIAIVTSEELSGEVFEEKSQGDLQIILDAWIDAENETPEQDIDGNDILQSRIVLDKFLR